MTITAVYSQAHDAMLTAASRHGLVPFDVRVLVALYERGGEGRTDELEQEMWCEGTAIRRSSLVLRDVGYILADAGPGTDRPRRGTRARLILTATGRQIASESLAWQETTTDAA